jgi:predicted RNA-binding Zn ribbon-like protein
MRAISIGPMRTVDAELSLALVNTAHGVSHGRDPLDSPAGLRSWLDAQRDLVGDPSDDVALRVSEFRELRGAIADLFGSLVAGGPVPIAAVERINLASSSVPRWLEVDATDAADPVVREFAAAVGRTVGILAAIARSAIVMVDPAEGERLRRCPAPRCGRFFLASRRGAIWCGPACGNRVRVARHHARVAALGTNRS